MFLGCPFLLIILSFNFAPIITQSSFSDSFSGSSINSIWSQYNDPGINIVQSNGVLTTQASYLGNSDKGAYLNKSISSNIKRIDMDYSFNFFSGMGRVYLIGKNPTDTKTRWIIGETDGWSSSNAKPVIFIMNPDGGPNSINASASWNKLDVNSAKSINSGGNGHITVQFLSDTSISVNFTFTKTYDGYTSKSGTFHVTGSTGVIELVFSFPPSMYYDQSECMKIDNYQENNANPTLKMSSYCSLSPSTNTYLNNPVVATTTTNAISPTLFNNNSSLPVLVILGIIIVSIVGPLAIITIYSRKKNYSRYSNNPNNLNNSNNWYYSRTVNHYSPNTPELNNLICPSCSSKIQPSDNFCEQCGSRIVK